MTILLGWLLLAGNAGGVGQRPNIVLILADDLGFAELGCYGQRRIRTPHIDRLAREGLLFRRAYAGGCVCAPSRSVLMTGLHTGHTPVRMNGGGNPLAADDATIAKVLGQAGYATGGFGKWGLGVENTPGHPNRQGFDLFFGYLHQVHAHFYYPYFLWKNEERMLLPENEGGKRGRYAHDLIVEEALAFLEQNKARPFFLYLPLTLPHVELTVPDDSLAPYLGQFPERPLPDPRAGYLSSPTPYAAHAGIISRLDDAVGRVLAKLQALGLDERTIVFFTSDNGPQAGPWAELVRFFQAKGNLRGDKGTLYEGGLRVPLLVRWPGRIAPGRVSDHLTCFQDFFPTLAELAAVTATGTDGISLVPTLLGQEGQRHHEFLYWEHYLGTRHDSPRIHALRMGKWKIVRPKPRGALELYDLEADESESQNLASQHPAIVARLAKVAEAAHRPPRVFPPESPRRSIRDYVR